MRVVASYLNVMVCNRVYGTNTDVQSEGTCLPTVGTPIALVAL